MARMGSGEAREHSRSGAAWEELCDRIEAAGSEVLRRDVSYHRRQHVPRSHHLY